MKKLKTIITITDDFLKLCYDNNKRLSNYKYEYLRSLCEPIMNTEIAVRCSNNPIFKNNGVISTICKCLPKTTDSKGSGKEFWRLRGWSDAEIYAKTLKNKQNKPKRLSPFNYNFYIQKYGYDEERAKYEANKIRPIKPEYWIERGFSSEDAIIKAEETKSLNNKKGSNKSKSSKCIFSDNTKIEYYIIRGFSEEAAKIALSERQSTFSLEKCIKKYGDNGYAIWKKRQDDWLKTLDAKSDEEKRKINISKNPFNFKRILKENDNNLEQAKLVLREKIYNKTGIIVPETHEELKEFILLNFRITDGVSYITSDLISDRVQMYIFDLFDFTKKTFIDFLNTFIIFKSDEIIKTKIGYYNQYTNCGSLLRSSNEIHFNNILKQYGLKENIDYEIEKYYPNSMMRSDFYLIKGNIFVELAGSTSEEYVQKMHYKKATFGSVILNSKSKYLPFITEYILNHESNN